MIKKEILDTLKQAGTFAILALIIPVVYLVNSLRLENNQDFIHYLDWGLTFLFPALILYMSWSIFGKEDSEDSWDYLRTLPVGRWKLFLIKTLPRIVLTIPIVCWMTFYRWGWTMYPEGNTMLWITVSLLTASSGFFLGLAERKNPAMVLLFSLPVLFLTEYVEGTGLSWETSIWFFLNVMKPNGWEYAGLFFWFSRISLLLFTLIPAALPVLALIPLYRDWNSCSKKAMSLKAAKRMAIPVMVLVAIHLI
ncbi:hypothetical protein CSA37_00095 [Candidatus Fermentibacteria bacterium]|nr:MAG: hypothetical protein CSA37_00095 [Candidatus Fermentibacteria bacterium]